MQGTPRYAITADLGNTRLKLCLFASASSERLASSRNLEEPLDSAAFSWADDDHDPSSYKELGEQLGAWLNSLQGELKGVAPIGVLGSVAGVDRTAWVQRALEAAGAQPVISAPEPGVVNATETPETVGQDRLLAARGALEWLRGNPGKAQPVGALVVDAGTALTVDAIAVSPDLSQARFLGGAIAPGPALLSSALATHTARLPAIDPQPGTSAWGRDTPGAIQAGVVVGFRGAARHLVLELGRETNLSGAPIFVTGGARRFLMEPESFLPDRVLLEDPWLVHRGLCAAGLFAARDSSLQ